MNAPMEILIDYMGYLNPEIRLIKRDVWINGIKLMPEDGRLDRDYLYFAQLSKNHPNYSNTSPVVFVCPKDVTPSAKLENCIILRTDISVTTIFNELLGTFNLIRTWVQEMEISVGRKEGVQRLIDLSCRVFGNPLAVITPSFKTIAATWEYETHDPLFGELIELGYLTKETYGKLKKSGFFHPGYYSGETCFLPSNDIHTSPVAVTAITQDSNVGFIVLMLCSNTPMSPGLRQLYQYLMEKLRYYLIPAADSEYIKSQFDYFIIDIIEGRVSTSRDIMERSRVYPTMYNSDFSTVLITHEGHSSMFLEHAMQVLSTIFSNVRPILYNSNIILHPDLSSNESRRNNFLSTLNSYLQSARAYAGVSDAFSTMTAMRQSYDQASEALRIGRSLKGIHQSGELIDPAVSQNRIFHFEDFQVYSLLSGGAKDIRTLDLIRKYDMDHHTDYYRILYVFLSLERNFTKVATVLHMHRNNVIYHAKRMSDIFGLDLDNPNQRLKLLLLYKTDDLLSASLI